MKDMISVVVICYNHATYIEQCLQSIFKQTYQNLELIVINDGLSILLFCVIIFDSERW